MKVTRLRATDFKCIEALDQPIASGGAIVRGGNGRGKSSVLFALQAALTGRGISPDAVRLGADRAEILVDLDDVTVRRVIPRDGRPTVSVKRADGTQSRPQSWLDDVIGPTLDPLDLFLAPPKERRARILAALPVRVTREQLLTWAPDLPESTSVDGHGLEVLARVRQWYYERRTSANAAEKRARDDADRLAADAAARSASTDASSVEDAERELRDAQALLGRLESQNEQARAAIERTASTRANIAGLRADAGQLDQWRKQLDDSVRSATARRERIAALESQLADERRELAQDERTISDARAAVQRREAAAAQADALEAVLANAGPEPVLPGALEMARAAIDCAHRRLIDAHVKRDAESARETAAAAAKEHAMRADEARRLDATVRALTDDAPRALLAASGGIPGLAIDGDSITLDGVALDGLCGAEQLQFAVEIAKRANAGRNLRLLVVDGMERLDPEQLETFVRLATADGFQLIGSRVDAGDIVVEAIEADAPKSKRNGAQRASA